MAHLIETMAYAGATPWHGLGNQLTQKQPIEVWQREAGMDWQILESPVHFKSDGWLLHNLNDELRQGQDGKLRSIPICLLFNEPDLNFRADYSLFDRTTGRPLCVGNGETCKRLIKGVSSRCPALHQMAANWPKAMPASPTDD